MELTNTSINLAQDFNAMVDQKHKCHKNIRQDKRLAFMTLSYIDLFTTVT